MVQIGCPVDLLVPLLRTVEVEARAGKFIIFDRSLLIWLRIIILLRCLNLIVDEIVLEAATITISSASCCCLRVLRRCCHLRPLA